MHKYISIALALALLATSLIAAGCSSAGSASSDESKTKVWGYVATADQAKLEVAESTPTRDSLRVDKVLSPDSAWLVVHRETDGKPGDRVGLLHVDEGISGNLDIPIDNMAGANIIVALHADKGTLDQFDFDMMNKETSADRPYFVDGKELAGVVALPD